MKVEHYYFTAFVVTAIAYVMASILDLRTVYFVSNILFVPFLMLFYFRKAEDIKWPLVLALILLYVRDIILGIGLMRMPVLTFGCFFVGIIILIIYAITEYQKSKVQVAEFFSFGIVYAFSLFLFYHLAEMVPGLVPTYEIWLYVYLLLLILFLSISFTVYFLKAHKASLWIMLCASALTFSETSLFFKSFVFRDLSVVLLHSLFHVIALLSIVMYALNRRSRNAVTSE